MNKISLPLGIMVSIAMAALMACQPQEDKQPEGQSTAAEEQTSESGKTISTKPGQKAESGEAETSEEQQATMAKLLKKLGDLPNSAIKPAPIPGWYEVARGSAIGYVSEDGRFLIDGDLIDLQTKVNLTEKRRTEWRKEAVASIGEENMIIFEPEDVKHTVTVFTDVDCGYCRKLHSQIDGYLEKGIRVRYVFYPLRGENAKSYKTAENVWCSDDRQDALTRAKLGQQIEAKVCETPVANHLQTGRKLGIRGTPGIVSEDGKLMPGYLPPKTLLSELNKGSQG